MIQQQDDDIDDGPQSGATDGAGAPEATTPRPKPPMQDYTPTSSKPGETPPAGDVDPGATASAEEQGQSGDTTQPKKRSALPWN